MKPNILFIITDQERYDSLGCCGNPFAKTPNIDALAKQGTIFENCITASSICQPSRASVLTGLHASVHGVWTNGVALPRATDVKISESSKNAFPGKWVASNITTFADIFKNAGYNTKAVGKLHFTPYASHPDSGFMECEKRWQENPEQMEKWHGPYYGFDDVNITTGHGEFIGGHYGLWLKKNHPDIWKKIRDDAKIRIPEFPECKMLYPSVIPKELHNSSWIGDVACEKIKENENSENPFLMWVGFPDPHSPFVPPKELADEFKNSETLTPPLSAGNLKDRPEAFKNLAKKRDAENSNPKLFKRARQYTNAMMKLIDENVGKMIDTLKETGQWENTIVIFTSDHGDFLGDFGMHGKCVPCCKSLNHVPFILKTPERILPERVSKTISNVDILPTICELAGLEIPKLVHGESVISVEKYGRKFPVIVQHYTPKPERHNISIYDDRYRLTWYPQTNEFEFYDHKTDPFESTNIVDCRRPRECRGIQQPDLSAKSLVDKMLIEKMFNQLTKEQTRTCLPRAGRVAVW